MEPLTIEASTSTAAAVGEDAPLGTLENLGGQLFGPFALPFEMASLLLLAAIIGAVVLGKKRAAAS